MGAQRAQAGTTQEKIKMKRSLYDCTRTDTFCSTGYKIVALQAEGGPGVPEAGEGAGGAPLGGGSEDGAGALLPVASGVVRETRGERSVSIA